MLLFILFFRNFIKPILGLNEIAMKKIERALNFNSELISFFTLDEMTGWYVIQIRLLNQ